MEELKKLAIDLVINHKIKHKTIINEIRKALLEESNKLPKLYVVYCGSHGGYGYSNQFKNFINDSKSTIDDDYPNSYRINVLEHILEFGKKCCEDYPIIANMIRIDILYDLSKIINNVYRTIQLKQDINSIKNNLETVMNTDINEFGSDIGQICFWIIQSNTFNIKEIKIYEKNHIINVMNTKIKEIESEIHSIIKESKTDVSDYDSIMESFEFEYDEEKEELQKPYYMRKKWDKYDDKQESICGSYIEFIDAIKLYGQDHWRIWKCQEHIHENTMRYLLFKKINITTDLDIDLLMGLLCASNPYCHLKIGEVPQIIDWRITEYDGLESISYN